MTRVRCWQDECRFWKEGICSSLEIEYYPDEGCTTMEEGEPEEEKTPLEKGKEEWEEEEWEEEEEEEEDEEDEWEDEE